MNRIILLHLMTILGVGLTVISSTGCTSDTTATVSGNVTLNGKPLAKGLISFSAIDDAGGTGGGDVVNGKYEAKGLPPGKYQVHIAGVPEGDVIMPGDPRTKRTMTDAEIRAMSDPIPADATGNDQTIELKAGAQQHDFKLESKSARS